MNTTVAVAVMAPPLSVPVTVADALLAGDVKTAPYVPSAWSVTLPSVPAVVKSATVPPLDVRALPYASFRRTVIVDVLEPLAGIDAVDAAMVECAPSATPAIAEAVMVTGEPVRLSLAAVSVFDPAVVPSVQLPTAAMPLAFVVADALVTEPPPVATANVTETPETAFPFASFIITLGAVATAAPAAADWLLPPFTAICDAAPTVPAAVNVTGEPARLPLVAVIVLDPTVVPRVQLPTVAMPLEFVAVDNPVAKPPPVATANVTDTPETGLPFASFIMTLGAVAALVPTVAD